MHDLVVHALEAAGLGLDHDDLGLARTTRDWISAGTVLRDRVAATLDGCAALIVVIGSSSVLDLLAKPIVDLAVALPDASGLPEVTDRLEHAGWIYRGDAGDSGGHVFVLETRPSHRVAHIHVVSDGDPQWENWLRFRDLLRSSPQARDRYEAVKTALVERHPRDRVAYTDGKTEVVRSLLASSDQ
jgi:GrpB-like predicted nucleotidyltransferase (UPF0157 family)